MIPEVSKPCLCACCGSIHRKGVDDPPRAKRAEARPPNKEAPSPPMDEATPSSTEDAWTSTSVA